MIESLFNSRPAWTQLGLVLAHFLWQGAAIAVVLAAVLWLLRKGSPTVRYGLCGSAMLLMAVSPVFTLWYVQAHPLPILVDAMAATDPLPMALAGNARSLRIESTGAVDLTRGVGPVESPGRTAAAGASAHGSPGEHTIGGSRAVGGSDKAAGGSSKAGLQRPHRVVSSAPAGSVGRRLWLAGALGLSGVAWCICVLVLSGRLLLGWWRLRRQYRRDTEGLPEAVEAIVRKLSERLGLAQRVRVVAARAWAEPIAFGLLRPVVFMPVAVLTQCPVELIEAMIAHELAHIRRYDLWVNMLQRVVETLLFYHPAVWWVSGRMRLERELCCDDLAVRATGRRADYATALVELCRSRPSLVAPALAAGIFGPKLSLLTRVRRILQVPVRSNEANRGRFWLAGPLSIMLAGAFVLVAGLRAAAPQGVATTQPAEVTNAQASAFTATLPGGITVELIGIASNKRAGREVTWWKPDGTPLDAAPYRDPGTYSNEAFPYEFAVKVSGADDFDLRAAASPGKEANPPNAPRGGRYAPGLRSVVLSRFGRDETETSIRLGLAAGPWQRVEAWLDYPWSRTDPEDTAIATNSGVIALWPRAEGSGIRVDISHTYTDVSTRLIALDHEGKTLVGAGGLRTPGRGIVRRVYRFDPLAMEDLKGFEFQQRPYDTWITFKNVSLRPRHRTQVQVEIARGPGNGSPLDTPAATRPADSDQRPVEIIQLRYADPAEMIHTLTPLLGETRVVQQPAPAPKPGAPLAPPPPPRVIQSHTMAALRALGSKSILVKADAKEMRQIKELIAMLDVEPAERESRTGSKALAPGKTTTHPTPFRRSVATRPVGESQLPFEKKTYLFKWDGQPLANVLTELQEKTGLSMPGADDIDGSVSEQTISFTSVRPVGFDEALLLVNHLIEDKGYWIVRRDQCLEIRKLTDWYRRIPPAQMFTSEEAYRKANLPKWEVASVVCQPRFESAKSLAGRASDQVPDNTARAVITPDGNRIELKGIVEYINQQLETIKKWDVPQDESFSALLKSSSTPSPWLGRGLQTAELEKAVKELEALEDKLRSSEHLMDSHPSIRQLQKQLDDLRKLSAKSLTTKKVYARADGVIAEVKVQEGQMVKKGDLLISLDDADTRLELEAAKIRESQLRMQFERAKDLKTLQPRGGISETEYQKAASELKLAEIEVERIELRLSRAQITSPADGKVFAAEGSPSDLVGKRVTAGDLLLRIEPSAAEAGTDEKTDWTAASRRRVGSGTGVATRPASSLGGAEVEDLRCQVKRVGFGRAGEPPQVAVAVENQQIREWYSDSNKPRVELVVDGRQYLATDGAPALSPRVPLGQSYAMILDLSPQQWHSANDGAPLKLGSGQHTVSAVLVAYTSRDAAEQPVRIFSKPVEIEGVGPSRRN